VKKYIITVLGVVTMMASVSRAHASDVGFSLGINLGNIAAQVYAPPRVAFEEPPQFMARPGLGFSFAVGTPYDLFYAADRYYLCRGNMWYAAPYYNGPWVHVGFRALPWGLRRYPIARLRYLRDEGWRHRGGDDDYNGYGHFRPEWRGRRDMQARWEGGAPCVINHYRHGMRREDDDD
jgi:hypothetical protein